MTSIKDMISALMALSDGEFFEAIHFQAMRHQSKQAD